MSKKELKFTEIIDMIAAGTVKEGQKFYTPARLDIDKLIEAEFIDGRLVWEENHRKVQLTQEVVSDKWYIEVPVEEYNRMLDRLEFLDCLEACGVDNWGGYPDAWQLKEGADDE